jgi:threonine/homoserine/homoserine lactone efflux protein
MSFATFVFAVLALLLAPGPTNTLMGVAGARGGLRRVARLVPAELLGYLTAILPLIYFGGRLLEQWPVAAVALKVAAAAWVMLLAVKLWGLRREGDGREMVTARKIYVTTMLNPKSLIFGLALFPPFDDLTFPARLSVFCLMVAGVAFIWGAAGMATQLGNSGHDRLQITQRVAAVWLAIVSVTLIAGVLRA